MWPFGNWAPFKENHPIVEIGQVWSHTFGDSGNPFCNHDDLIVVIVVDVKQNWVKYNWVHYKYGISDGGSSSKVEDFIKCFSLEGK